MTLSPWMRRAFLATAGMNVFGAALFAPPLPMVRELFGLPGGAHPLYLWILAIWIADFGVAYLWLGLTGRPDRTLIAVGAVGKLSFSLLLAVYWMAGDLPWYVPLAGSSDLGFAILFLAWLWRTRGRG